MYLTQHCGMAATNSDNVVWHTSLTALPNIPGDTVERFVSMPSVAKETSLRGYKFFLESYIHDVQGKKLE
jgi:hypothetical protein